MFKFHRIEKLSTAKVMYLLLLHFQSRVNESFRANRFWSRSKNYFKFEKLKNFHLKIAQKSQIFSK